jgi:ribose 5-phosphate isomerase A
MSEEGKRAVAAAVAAEARAFEMIGVGTGTTVDRVLEALTKDRGRIKTVVATSYVTARAASQAGLKVCDLEVSDRLPFGFDGADRILTDTGEAIKGGGAALADEAAMALLCDRYILAVDESKVATSLGGAGHAIPFEVDRAFLRVVEKELHDLGASSVTLRRGTGSHDPVTTRRGNFVLDVQFPEISAPKAVLAKAIPGVMFVGYWPSKWTDEVWVGYKDGTVTRVGRKT